MRQYEVGEAVRRRASSRRPGPRALDAAWRGPECLPTIDELDHPVRLARARRARRAGPGCLSGPVMRRASRATRSHRTCSLAARSSRRPRRTVGSPASVRAGGRRMLRRGRLARVAGLAVDRGLAPIAVHVDHGLRDGSGREHEVVAAHAAVARAPNRVAVRVDVGAGGNLEARARDARYEALAAPPRAHGASDGARRATPPTTRPRPCCSRSCGGARSAGLAGMAVRRGRIVRPLLGGAARRDRGGCAPRSGSIPCATRRTTTAPSAGPGSATRCCRSWPQARAAISCRSSPARPTCCGPRPSTSTRSPGAAWPIAQRADAADDAGARRLARLPARARAAGGPVLAGRAATVVRRGRAGARRRARRGPCRPSSPVVGASPAVAGQLFVDAAAVACPP